MEPPILPCLEGLDGGCGPARQPVGWRSSARAAPVEWEARDVRKFGRSLRETERESAGLVVARERNQATARRVLEKPVEGAIPVIRLVEAGLPPLQRLLDHRPPDHVVLT